MTLQKVGYEGVWLFELAATDTPRRVLERAQSARRRLERFLVGVKTWHTSRTSRSTKAQQVTIHGWLYNRRSSGKIHFLQVRDGSGFIQAVMSKAAVGEEAFKQADHLSQETSLSVTGTVRADARAPWRVRDRRHQPRGPPRSARLPHHAEGTRRRLPARSPSSLDPHAAAAGDPARAARSDQRGSRLLQPARLHPLRHAHLHAGGLRGHDQPVPGPVLRGHDRVPHAERAAVQRGQRDGARAACTASARRSAPRSPRRAGTSPSSGWSSPRWRTPTSTTSSSWPRAWSSTSSGARSTSAPPN